MAADTLSHTRTEREREQHVGGMYNVSQTRTWAAQFFLVGLLRIFGGGCTVLCALVVRLATVWLSLFISAGGI